MDDSQPLFDVVGGGAVAVDDLVFVAGPLGDGKGRVIRRERRYGGNSAVALVAAAESGVRVGFIGRLPDEASEPGLLARLQAAGIDLSVARFSMDTRLIQSTILVGADGARFIAFDDNCELGVPPDLDLGNVRNARVLVLDEYGGSGSVRAARFAREASIPVVIDVELGIAPELDDLLILADHLVVPLDFARKLTGEEAPTAVADWLWRADRAAVVLTAGHHGCYYRGVGDSGLHHRAAEPVNVVDTTGCGDAFHGAYAAALSQGADLIGCVDAATRKAAECATHPGGMTPLT